MSPCFARTDRIYADHAATTPVRPEVEEAMRPFASEDFGNPSSLYREGRRAREALEESRETIRRALSASGFDVVFTGGGTEADNKAILGVVLARRERGDCGRVLTSSVEHPAVLNVAPLLELLGSGLVTVSVDADGRADPGDFERAMDGTIAAVSLMFANNEVGTTQPVAAVAGAARERGMTVHCDAVQAVGKVPLRLDELDVDLVTISGHKVSGPKGVGALLVRRGVSFSPLIRGGSQQRGLRAGTEAVAMAVGLARAVELATREVEEEVKRLEALRRRLREGIAARFEHVLFNTPAEGTLPHILNVSFGVEGESLLKLLDSLGVAASTGSACSVGSGRPSHVLLAMGRSDRQVRGSVRLSLGRLNGEDEVEPLLERLEQAVGRLERIAPPAS